MTASLLVLVQFVTFDEKFGLSPLILSKCSSSEDQKPPGRGKGDTVIYELYGYVPL